MPPAQPHVEHVFRGGTTGGTDFTLSVLTKSHPLVLGALRSVHLQVGHPWYASCAEGFGGEGERNSTRMSTLNGSP